MRKNIHVVPKDGQWAVKKPHSERASFLAPTQKSAIQKAVPMAKRERAELLIHNAKGVIRNSNSYGNDPYPPRDKK